MKSFVCFAMLAVLAGVQCARVPAHYEHGVGRVRRSINPWDFFNNNKKTKKIVKKKPKPKPTTQATTPSTQALTTTPSVPSVNVTVKNKMPEYIAEKMGKLKTKDQVMRFLGITAAMSQKINVKKTLPISGVSGQSSGPRDWQYYVVQWTSIYCLPRPQVIHFPQQRLYHGIIYPYGAMALRCGGCCAVSMHHCVPDKVKSKIHSVYFVPYSYMVSSQRSSRKKRNSNGHEILQISVEDHETCKCQCKVGPQDCDPLRQYHLESTCQCKCRDAFTESRMNCTKPFVYDKETCNCECAYHHRHCPSARQQWDRKQCKCTCDDRIRCPMGSVMNKNCECEDIQMSNKVPNCKKSNTQ